MTRLRLSGKAREALRRIRLYSVERYGGRVADAYLRGFSRAFDLLERHPRAGAIEPGFAGDIRSFVHRRHLIVYQLQGSDVLVIDIVHQARDLDEALRESNEDK